MSARPAHKDMWAILHIPSGTWDHGHSNETLFWAEHEAALFCRVQCFDPKMETWKPIKVRVTVSGERGSI